MEQNYVPLSIVITHVSVFVLSNVDVAVIVAVPVAVAPTVTLPKLSTVTLLLLLVQTTDFGANPAVTTVAVSETFTSCPAATVIVAGVTSTDVTLGAVGVKQVALLNGL